MVVTAFAQAINVCRCHRPEKTFRHEVFVCRSYAQLKRQATQNSNYSIYGVFTFTSSTITQTHNNTIHIVKAERKN